MSLLTDREINSIAYDDDTSRGPVTFARAVEAAVIKKLVTVSVEPVATVQMHPDGRRRVLFKDSVADCDAQWRTTQQLYTPEALAAARVQAINECADLVAERFDVCEPWITPDMVRELIGGKE